QIRSVYFLQAEDGIRDRNVTGVQTCALPISIKIADQIILMKDGEIVQKGSPQEILDNPADDFVKEFIGEKRLQVPELPNLKKLIDRQSYVRVTTAMSNEEMVAKLVQQNMGEAIVVDDADDYVGTVSLYDDLADKSKSVNQ